jgi:hypothetical protein
VPLAQDNEGRETTGKQPEDRRETVGRPLGELLLKVAVPGRGSYRRTCLTADDLHARRSVKSLRTGRYIDAITLS